MPLLLLVLVAVSAGLGSGLAAWRYPRLSAGSSAPAFTAARKVGESAAAHSRFRRTLVSRLDASAATGLALTLALLLTIVGGLGLGALAYLERTKGQLTRADRSVASWGHAHATGRMCRSGARPSRRARGRGDDSDAERMDRPFPARAARRRGDPHDWGQG